MAEPYRLITIPPSHYCEKARWGLKLLGVPYREERHPPMLHYLACRRAGGNRTTPVLVTDLGVYPDSTEILQFLDGQYGNGCRLYPRDPAQRAEVDELEEQFDTKLGPHTRRLAYYHLLPSRRLVMETVLPGASTTSRLTFGAFLPIIRFLMRRGMNINAESAQRSTDRIRETFRAVEERLDDGGEYLVGGQFTAADLTFAALAAPVVLPRNYGSQLPSLADLPSDLLPVVDEMRSSPAGDFALRLYRDHR